MGDADRQLRQPALSRSSIRSTPTTSASCRSPGRSRPACCAATKADRWSSANVMYVHTPFPNIVYALDLNNDGRILWKYEPKQDPNVIPVMCCDTVNRGVCLCRRQDLPAPGRHDAGRARCQDRQGRLVGQERRSRQGRDRHVVADDRQGQGPRRHFRRRVRRARLGDRLQHQGRQAGLARLFDGPRQRHADRPAEDHRSRQAGRARIPAPTPGRATSGRSAAAPPGAGTPTIRSST